MQSYLDRYVERLNDTGLPDRSREAPRQELDVHEDAIGGFDDLSELYLDAGSLDSFRASAGLTEAQWAENEPSLRQEMRKARRDQIKAILSTVESLEGYSFTETRPDSAKATTGPLCGLQCRDSRRQGRTRAGMVSGNAE